MPPEGEWARSWLDKADHDMAAATRLAEEPPGDPAIIAFHAQQAVEKCLKAFLLSRDVEFEKLHSIRYLLDLCTDIDAGFEALRAPAQPLTRYAVMTRYPVAGPDVTLQEAREALAVAGVVRQFVRKRVPGEDQPTT